MSLITLLTRGGYAGACVALRAQIKRLALGAAAGLVLTVGAAQAEEPSPVTIVALGDSLTHGYGLAQEDGFTPQLEAWLKAAGAGPVTVVNAGQSGDTTSGGLARVDWSVGPEAQVVIVELGANDMLRGVDPAIARDNLDKIVARLKERNVLVLLTSIDALANWGEEYKRDFDAIFPDLAEKHDVPMTSFFPPATTGGDLSDARKYLQSDNLHPNKAGVALIVEHLGPKVLELAQAARDPERAPEG